MAAHLMCTTADQILHSMSPDFGCIPWQDTPGRC